jgi:ribosomal protein L12E/L44/L45/RPP1/RPP2
VRTAIYLPDALYRQVKAKAALEGVAMEALVQRLVERGLAVPAAPAPARARSALPTLSIGRA